MFKNFILIIYLALILKIGPRLHETCTVMEEDGCKNEKQETTTEKPQEKRKGGYSSNDRIVGGTPTFHPMPWMVVLSISGSQCGGSLINRQFVLTAAHCFCGGKNNSYFKKKLTLKSYFKQTDYFKKFSSRLIHFCIHY